MNELLDNNPIAQFAADHYNLGSDSAISGPYHIENSPWHAEIFRALSDQSCREITARMGAQLGKNLIAEIWAGYVIANAPGNMLINGQTDEDAKLFAQDRVFKRLSKLGPVMPAWPFPSGRYPKSADLLLPHMYILAQGANSSNLQGKSARYMVNDELHLWASGMLDNARDRASAFWDAKILNISTAGDEDSDEHFAYMSGTQECWHLGCPDCGKKVRLKWADKKERVIIWEDNDLTRPEGKVWNFQEVKKTIRFVCPHCKCEHEDSLQTRVEMNRLGGYDLMNTNAPEDKRSFHVSQLAAPWVPWEEIVERWIKATERLKTGDVELLKNFIVKRLAETWEHQSLGGTHAVITGGYTLKDVFQWQQEARRFLTVDVQEKGGRHFWAVARSWSEDGKSRLVQPAKLNTWADVDAMAKENRILPGSVCVDARFATSEVLEACAIYGWTWMQADEKARQYGHRIPESDTTIFRPYSTPRTRDPGIGTRTAGRRLSYGINFSKEWVRELIHRRIMGLGTEWGLPDDIADLEWKGTSTKKTSYLEQLNSWVMAEKVDKQTNKPKKFWKKINRDDHLRACEEMQLVAAAMQGMIPSSLNDEDGDNS